MKLRKNFSFYSEGLSYLYNMTYIRCPKLILTSLLHIVFVLGNQIAFETLI